MSHKKDKKKWSVENEIRLLKLIADDVPLEKISKKIKKEESYIKHKLKKIALRMRYEKKTKDEPKETLGFID